MRQLTQQKVDALGVEGRPLQWRTGETDPTSPPPSPTLTTISANAYVWGYNFVLPAAALSALKDGGTFAELLGAIPPELEPVAPVVEAHLGDNLASVAAMDEGAGVILAATWISPEALVPVPVDWQPITSWLEQDLVISVEGASTEPGSRLVIFPYKSSDNDDQMWTYVNGLYIQNRKSGLFVEIADSNMGDGGRIQINNYTGAPHQQWAVCGDGFLRNLMSGNVIDLSGGSITPGTPLISYHPKYPATQKPPSNQGWWTPWSFYSCNNLVTVITNSTSDLLTVQGVPQSTTVLAYGAPVQIIPPGAVAVYVSFYDNTIGGDNNIAFYVYSEVAPGVAVSFNSHQHDCGLEAGKLWVDNVAGNEPYVLNTQPSDWYRGGYAYTPGTIVCSVSG